MPLETTLVDRRAEFWAVKAISGFSSNYCVPVNMYVFTTYVLTTSDSSDNIVQLLFTDELFNIVRSPLRPL